MTQTPAAALLSRDELRKLFANELARSASNAFERKINAALLTLFDQGRISWDHKRKQVVQLNS